MEPIFVDKSRLAVLLAACALLASLELVTPLFRFRSGRARRALPNLMLAAGVVGTNLALASVTASVSSIVTRKGIGLLAKVHADFWVLLMLGVAGLDLFAYLAHVLLHKLPLGWRFHRVHHSEPEVDVTTAFRQHPGETFWRLLWQCIGTVVFGVPFWILPLYLSISSLNALLEHANLRTSDRLDKWLRWVIVTPNMHKVHHSRVPAETDSNYSNIFSVWDRLFKTYTARVNFKSLRYGLEGYDDIQMQSPGALIKEPFRAS
jgi:sterol desaturase/sphingolipid hydroxylase (fatty acid hydroxylase superfamily)